MGTTKLHSRVVGFEMVPSSKLKAHPDNVRRHPKAQVVAFRAALKSLGFAGVILARKLKDGSYQVLDGHMRVGMLDAELPTLLLDLNDNEALTFLMIHDPIGQLAELDMEKINGYMQDLPAKYKSTVRKTLNMDAMRENIDKAAGVQKEQQRAESKERKGALAERFGAPPFTVLDARQGYWLDRKREWLGLGLASEEGRDDVGSITDAAQAGLNLMAGSQISETGTSIFDPVLTELMYRWFCLPGGGVLDPFAGGSTRGIVAHYLGYKYTGIEIRLEQIKANKKQLKAMAVAGNPKPKWVQGSSLQLGSLLPKSGKFDLLFSCPPYFDLETYGGGDDDISEYSTYTEFMDWYSVIFTQAVERVKQNRFVILVLGDMRDKKGAVRGFVSDNVQMFRDMGLSLYNDAVLVTPIGTLPLRVGKAFQSGRKLGRGHQHVLIWYKGSAAQVKKYTTWDVFGEEFGDD